MNYKIKNLIVITAIITLSAVFPLTSHAEEKTEITQAEAESFAETSPKLKSITAQANSVKVSWGSVEGANGYAVLKKTGSSGSWKRIATTKSTSYTDKSSLKNGKKYFYTVRAYKGSQSTALKHTYSAEYWSGYDADGQSFTYTKAPTLKKTANTTSGIKVTWKKTSGAKGYAVLRKTQNGKYKELATTSSTSYTDKTAKAGTTYFYTVRAYRGSKNDAQSHKYNAACWSGYKASGIKARYLKTPSSLKVTTNKASRRVLKWKGVKNASGYAVFRKATDGSWKMIGTTTKKSYTDKSKLTKGKKYSYTVRAYRGKLKTAKKNKYNSYYWSASNASGVSFKAKGTSNSTSEKALALGAVKESGRTSGGKLTRRKGVVWYHGHKETYYSQKVLKGGKLKIPGRHVASDGTVRDKNDFICIASGKYKKGTIVETSLGVGKVYDSGCARNTIDLYVNW